MSGCALLRTVMKRPEDGTPEQKKYDVNYSSILTRLIHDTGRFSVCYASDLFVEWEHFIKTLLSWEETEDSTYIFGIREMGVDNDGPVIKALKNGKYDRYRAICAWSVPLSDQYLQSPRALWCHPR